MSLAYNEEIKTILAHRVEGKLLYGYYGGIFSADLSKLYGVTMVDVSTIDYDEFSYWHGTVYGTSSSFHDFEKTKKYLDDGCWQSKSTEECIEEGIYRYFSVAFTGMLFEGEWFILKSLHFYGEEFDEDGLKKHAERGTTSESFWDNEIFYQKKPLELNRGDKTTVLRDINFEEFKYTPYLVALLKEQKKEKINLAYCRYVNEEFLEPFFQKLRILYPDDFVEIMGLRIGYTMVFPQHKRYTLFCGQVKNNDDKWKLRYFLFNNEPRKFYEWTYFEAIEYDFSFFYSELIIDDLKKISHWDDDGFLDSSCTMDDQNFWDDFVFKRDDNSIQYLYLKEMG